VGFTTYTDAIRVFFSTQWAANGDGTEIVYENVDYKPTTGTGYSLFAVRPSETTWDSPDWRSTLGAVVFAVLSPSNAGPEAAEIRAELIAAQFRKQTFLSDAGTFDEPSIEPQGPTGQGWYQVNVRVPFHYQEPA
jgi:hypothetical protein